jgi:alpha-galactosidase/6-phospho-beta-glucosidase family protein
LPAAGDRRLVLQAMLNDPFTGRLPVNEIEKILGELLEANRAYLPLLFEKRYAGSSSV